MTTIKTNYADGGGVFKSPKGWKRTQKDEGQSTYKNISDNRVIIISESHPDKSFIVTWEIEKSYNWEDWKTKQFPMTQKGKGEAEKFMLKLMNTYADIGKLNN